MFDVRALIFDMDGVIVDSNPLHVKAWSVYNGRFGLPMDEAMQGRMFGKRNDELVRDFFGEEISDEEVLMHGAAKEAVYREMLGSRVNEFLVPGVRDFLERNNQLPIGLGTNAEPANVDFILANAKLRHFFRAVVDGHQVKNAKPHPEVYLRVTDLLGIAPEFCVVFEDSNAGVQAGLAAGMRVVGISTTYQDLPGTSFMVPDFRGLTLEALR